jgi:RND family efflux transporter MFP subunit
MARQTGLAKQLAGWGRTLVVICGFSVLVAVPLLYLAGKFSPKVSETPSEAAQAERPAGTTVEVRQISLPVVESAVGSIRAVREMAVGSKLLARVVEVNLRAGQEVKTDDVLVRLDDTDLQAKLQQAKATVTSMEAVRAQALADEQRSATLIQSNAISRQDYEKAQTALRSADAELQRARETVNEVQAALDWATVRAPFDGTVIDKQVDVGDMVTPGQLLVTLYDPKQMQLVANVRESLTHMLGVGQDIGVRIDGLDKQCTGKVSEIVPQAQASSRAFQVKVTGPCPDGIYSGMFGRILIPLGEESVTVIPRQAIRKVGQLELVEVMEQDRMIQRAIRTGRELGDVTTEDGKILSDQIEVLSGLQAGELVFIPATSSAVPAAAAGGQKTDAQSGTAQEASHE